jgi:hypothetical protein
MTLPVFTAPDMAAPYLAPQHVRPSAARVWDGFVAWMLVSSMTILVCSFIGGQEFGVLRTVQTAARVPIAMALARLAHADHQGYIDHIEWAKVGDLSSLRVYPTAVGRQASIGLVGPDEAWAEVLALAPDADIPGMRQQFVCHWRFAELAEPGKTSWNLEPWRPLVDNTTMIWSRCNPGGTEETF